MSKIPKEPMLVPLLVPVGAGAILFTMIGLGGLFIDPDYAGKGSVSALPLAVIAWAAFIWIWIKCGFR